METAIIYSSKNGTTGKVSNMIAGKIGTGNNVSLISLSETSSPDLALFDKVIPGTSIYAGKPRSEMSKFCSANRVVLENKTIGLFICGMQPVKKEEELKGAYPDYLHRISKAEAFMGENYYLKRCRFLSGAL